MSKGSGKKKREMVRERERVGGKHWWLRNEEEGGERKGIRGERNRARDKHIRRVW